MCVAINHIYVDMAEERTHTDTSGAVLSRLNIDAIAVKTAWM